MFLLGQIKIDKRDKIMETYVKPEMEVVQIENQILNATAAASGPADKR